MNLAVVLTAPGAPNVTSPMTALHADSAARLVDTILAELEGQKLGQLLLINMAPDGPLHPLSSVWLAKLSQLRGVFEPGGSVAIVRNTKPLVGAAGLSGMGGMGGFGGGSSVGAPPSFQTLELSRALGVPVHLRT